MSKIFVRVIAVVLSGFLALAGCGDKPAPKTQIVGANPASPAVPQPPADPLGPRYEATLAEGIDFKKPGYPVFLAEVAGMSGYEPGGRWSDAAAGEVVKFRFKKPLPRKIRLEISVNAFGPNLGEPVKIRFDNVEKVFVHKDPKTPGTYSVVFDTVNGGDTIEIVPPKPISPSDLKVGADTRKLGIAFVALKILN